MSLLRIDASILGEHSASRALGDTVQHNWFEEHPGTPVVYRDLATTPIPTGAWAAAVTGGQTAQDQRTEEQNAGLALAQELLDELLGAETIIVATGLYNWGLNQLIKAWLDQVLVVAATQGEILKGKDVAIVVTRGGYYGEDGPKAGWDHGTPWLVRIFSEVFGANVSLVERDFTLVGVNPALDDFKDHAAALKSSAEEKANEVGKELATVFAARKAS